jgi:hypothetical protein
MAPSWFASVQWTGQTGAPQIVDGGTRDRRLSQLAVETVGRHVLADAVEATATGSILRKMLALSPVSSLAEGCTVLSVPLVLTGYEPRPAGA